MVIKTLETGDGREREGGNDGKEEGMVMRVEREVWG